MENAAEHGPQADNANVKRICCLVATALIACAQAYDLQRAQMVRDQIAARGIKNPAVLKAMRETPREQFMPPGVRAFTAPLSSMEVDAKN